MARLHFLGTGAAVSDPHRSTTMLALENESSLLLVDCGGDAIQRAMALGLELAKLRALIVTHEHADHVSGFPLLMEKLWLLGRREPLPVCGIAPVLAQAQRLHDSFDIADWYEQGYPGIRWQEVAHHAGASVWQEDGWQVTAAPGRHAVPVVGLRFIERSSGQTVTYSGDTEPVESIRALAADSQVLVHEATGAGPGHSSALQAADTAAQAGVGKLYLVHLPPREQLDEAVLAKARARFAATEKAEEGSSVSL